jgi:glycosyltransferase involved in cell wall biosynthesis
MSPRRIIYDVTMLSDWIGAPSGILRVDRAFAQWARANLPDAIFAFYDPELRRFRKVADHWVEPLIDGSAFADTWGRGAGAAAQRHRRGPARVAKWLTQPRRQLFAALERIRNDGRPAALRTVAGRLQDGLMSHKYREALVAADGTRRVYVPFERAFEAPVAFSARDTLVAVGSGWIYLDPSTFETLKEEAGCAVVVFCHDLIPLIHPEHCIAREVEQFRAYFRRVIPFVDRVIVSTRTNEAELRAYCARHDIRLGETRVTPFGAEVPSARRPGPVEGLVSGRYALFVSTIEPRKGHRLLCRVWARLRREGVVDGFRLAVVGRPGWNADAILAELQAEAKHGTIRLFAVADDALLAALHDGAAFCVGYGLPIVEAFARGKAVIASDRGSIPEIAAAFAPCLDPTDEEAWLGRCGDGFSTPQRAADTRTRSGPSFGPCHGKRQAGCSFAWRLLRVARRPAHTCERGRRATAAACTQVAPAPAPVPMVDLHAAEGLVAAADAQLRTVLHFHVLARGDGQRLALNPA